MSSSGTRRWHSSCTRVGRMNAATNETSPPRYWTLFTDRMQRLRALGSRIERPQELHILGAGVAGLAAAIEILRLPGPKHSVTIHEASNRVGGRIFTKRLGPKPLLDEPDTRPIFERGAMRIPTSHDYTWAYAGEATLERRRFLNDDRTHDFLGVVDRPPKLEELARRYGVRDRSSNSPGDLFKKNVLDPEMKLLDDAYADQGGRRHWATKLINGDIRGEVPLLRIDGVTTDAMLEQRLPHDPGQKRYIAQMLFAGLLDRSFLTFVRSALTNFGKLYELCKSQQSSTGPVVVGGMDLLVDGMLALLDPNIIRFGHAATEIITNQSDWQVKFANGDIIRRGGNKDKHLLCTIPYSALRDLTLTGFSNEKIDAIKGLSYVHATKVAVHFSERFWEPGMKGGRSVTDNPITSTYYPCDHNDPEPIPRPRDEEVHADYDLYTQPIVSQSEPEALAFAAREPRPGPWLTLTSYSFGERAEDMGRRTPLSTVEELQRVFPEVELRGLAVEEDSETWHWNAKPWFKGALVLPTPGNVSKFYAAARRPDGQVFFAGEHLSPEPGWIQGALFSSLFAVQQILAAALGEEEVQS